MEILHLSDIHVGNGLNTISETKNMKKIVKIIVQKWRISDIKPVILVTGDVTDSGSKREYKRAHSIFNELKKQGFEVCFAPGNHDYGVKGNYAEKKRFKRFKKYLCGVERVSYPYVKVVPQVLHEVVFIGLNSMKAETNADDRFLADGELGENQLVELAEILDDLEELEENGSKYVKVVYLHHHPFILPHDKENAIKLGFEKMTHMLKDGNDLMQLLKGRVDAVLFGHDHHHENYSRGQEQPLADKYAISTILSCGKTTKEENGKFPVWLLGINDNGEIAVTESSLS